MPDDKSKQGWQDDSKVDLDDSSERSYFRGQIRAVNPFVADNLLEDAINECRRELAPDTRRRRLAKCVLRRLGVSIPTELLD